MTAKEKAEELVYYFYDLTGVWASSKQCAVKVTDEISSINNERMYQLTWVKEDFYKEVKKEIEKL